MTTIVCALWLAAKRERFSCNNQALLATCSCPKHNMLWATIQSVFNLIVDIYAMVNWQLFKKSLLTSVTWLCHGLKCTTHRGDVFFKVIHWPVFLVLIDHRLRSNISHCQRNCLVVSITRFHFSSVNSAKRPYNNNLLTSSVWSLQGNLRPWPWCVDLSLG